MKARTGYVALGAFGAATLGIMVAIGYVQDRIDPRPDERVAMTKPLSERQMLERRRGRMAEIAIVGATVQ
ncbi:MULTISPECIES: hypothetical protein [unclassified Sphingomonas]|uniref:hypothetical protein n=1 Tax=unclassified Sphingomonas TaxID=196159 RepID=UPI000A5CFA8C|nr:MULTISPECIES: hypothetical protein [unclassified Sphingomonas]